MADDGPWAEESKAGYIYAIGIPGYKPVVHYEEDKTKTPFKTHADAYIASAKQLDSIDSIAFVTTDVNLADLKDLADGQTISRAKLEISLDESTSLYFTPKSST